MKLKINGEERQVQAIDLQDLMEELCYSGAKVATARNGEIVHKGDRADTALTAGDAIEIVAPMQGG